MLFEQMLDASLRASVIASDAAISACDPAEITVGAVPGVQVWHSSS